jgi:hypothetical protein
LNKCHPSRKHGALVQGIFARLNSLIDPGHIIPFISPGIYVLLADKGLPRPPSRDSWNVLYNFRRRKGEGYDPNAGVVRDAQGNRYGATMTALFFQLRVGVLGLQFEL